MLTRDEFNQAFGAALKQAREVRGLSQEEAAAALSKNSIKTPQEEDEYLRTIAALCTVATSMREEQGWTPEQLAERSQIPVEFLRNLEAAKDFNPDPYFLYCLSWGLGITYSEFWRRAEELLLIPDDEIPLDDETDSGDSQTP